MDKKNCFAYKDGQCQCLKVKDCKECNFYKSVSQFEKETGKTYEQMLKELVQRSDR